jgi:glycosyltransferase involved in cell wall biosynthesis
VKILLVHNSYQQPGGEDVVFEQESLMLRNAGHEVVQYRRSNHEVQAFRALRKVTLAKRTLWASDTRKDFVRLLRQEKPEIVHVHNTFVMISPSIYSACNEARIPVVQTLHNYRFLCPSATFFRDGKVCEECLWGSLSHSIQHGCYRNSRPATAVVAAELALHRLRGTWSEIACFVALSEFSRRKFIEGGFPADRILVKPNFVHPDPSSSSGERNCAVFVGRLSPEKRVSTVLGAWKLLQHPIPLVVIGGGPDQPQLEADAERRGLSTIRFLGQVPRAEALAWINKARFLIFSSEWYENFPVTIAESFACATPVIASNMGAMREIVSDGRTGFLFSSGDSSDLAQKAEWAWTHPDEMRTMGAEARKEYEAKYTAEKNYPMLMQIYDRALATCKN